MRPTCFRSIPFWAGELSALESVDVNIYSDACEQVAPIRNSLIGLFYARARVYYRYKT